MLFKKCKRILAVVLAAGMILSLVACGSDVEDQKDNDKDNQEQDDTNKDNENDADNDNQGETDDGGEGDADVEVNYDPFGKYDELLTISTGLATGNYALLEGDTLTDNPIQDYYEERLNVRWEYEWETPMDADHLQQLSLAIISEDLPDIISCDYNTVKELAEADLIWDLTEIFENYASDVVKKEFTDAGVMYKGEVDGKLYSLCRYSNQPCNAVFVRGDWMDELGLTVDEDDDGLITREELEYLAKAFVENDPGETGNPVGFAARATLGWDATNNLATTASSFGAHYRYWFMDENGQVYADSISEEVKDAVTWHADMYEKGLLDPNFGITTQAEVDEMYISGRMGIAFSTLNATNWHLNMAFETDKDCRWNTYYLDNGEGYAQHATYDATNRWVVVSKECENPEVLIKLLNLQYEIERNKNLAEEAPELQEYIAAGQYSYLIPFNLACVSANLWVNMLNDYNAYFAGEITLEEIGDFRAKNAVLATERYEEVGLSGLTTAEHGLYMTFTSAIPAYVKVLDAGKFLFDNPIVTPNDFIDWDNYGYVNGVEMNTVEEKFWVECITGVKDVEEAFDAYVKEWNAKGGDTFRQAYQDYYDSANE